MHLDDNPHKGSHARLEQSLEHGANQHPTKAAITYLNHREYKHISYEQLNTKARHLGACLEHQIPVSSRADTPFVGIFLARSVGQVVAILATLTAGAAYVPIALDITESSFRSVLDQTGAAVIVTDSEQQAHLDDLLKKVGRNDVATIDIAEADRSQADKMPRSIPLTSASPAYVLFSSGTTGTPKGIVTPHSAVQTYCEGANKVYQATSDDKWVLASSYTFDSSIDEIFCPLMVGAEIVIQPSRALADFMSYLEFLEKSGATILTITTALWHRLASFLIQEKTPLPPKIRVVSVGGEAAMTSILKEWRATFGDHPRFLNGYGPTETTVCATYWECQEDLEKPVLPIGRPLPNYKCYVLDPVTNSSVGSGQEGVLFVSGPGLAIGYLNNPMLTEQRFVPNPWAESVEYARMYNTGDLVRVDEKGVFHFQGRADLQVKIRGFRVEIEAVEAWLLTHPRVKEVAVVASTEQQSQIIIAYIVERPSEDASLCVEDFIDHCRQKLAHYEIPAHFNPIDKLPCTRNGKLDRRALKSLSVKQFPFREDPVRVVKNTVGDVNPVLVDLWCQCLEKVSPAMLKLQSNFIHLGGHSLTLITLAAKIHSTIGVKMSAIDLLQNPTLSQMSALIDKSIPLLNPSDTRPAACAPNCHDVDDNSALGGTYLLSSAQARLYVVQQNSPDSPFFNDGLAIQIKGEIYYDRLYSALMTIFRRHGILRIKLVQDVNAQVSQEVMPFDYSHFSKMFSHDHLERSAAEERAREIFSKPFDFFSFPLINISLLSSGNAEHILVVCAHHIIWDGFSDKIFLDELVALYQGKDISPSSSYFECFSESRANPDKNYLSSLVSYLDSVPQLLELPLDFVRPNIQTFSRGRSTPFVIDPHAVSRLVDRLGSTPFSCLMTAFAATLHLWAARQEDFMIGVPFANRLSVEAANAIGFFVNMLPLRVKFANLGTLDELHAAIRQDLLFLTEMQDVPVDSLINALGMNRLASRDTLLQTILNFTDAPDGNLDSRAKYSRFPLSNGAAHTDLTCFVEVGQDGTLLGELEYDSEIFADDSMKSFTRAFVHVIDSWSSNMSQTIDHLVFPEQSTHIPLMRDPDLQYNSLGEFMATIAGQYAERQALDDDTTGTSYTYKQLFSMSQCIQHHLRPFQRPDAMVLLLLERNVDVVAAEIGVNLAGMAWVPCDVSQPLARIRDIATDSNPACIIAHKQVLRRLDVSHSDFAVPIILVDEVYGDLTTLSKSHSSVVADAAQGQRAYMIYTSGSTGKPKGIVIGHTSIILLIRECMSWAESGVSFNCTATSNVAWDMSMMHFYPALATGGCIKLPKINGDKDGEYLSVLMKKSPKDNITGATPSMLRMWFDQTMGQPESFFPDGMCYIIVGGEEFTPKLAQRVLAQAVDSPLAQVIHIYGPTEGTIFHSIGSLKHTDHMKLAQYRRVPIDRPFSHASMTIVGPAGNQLPLGFVGEIIIWGSCLMLEYNNLPELNANKFLFKDGVRGWRTGDLGRQLPSGKFEIFGRMDSMCKIRGGFRVDLCEIEAHIRSHTEVDECCVSLAGVPTATSEVAERQIVAHVKFKCDTEQANQINESPGHSASQQNLTGLFRHLSRLIPAYMTPDYVVQIEEFPLTPSTKVDKAKLPKAYPSDRFIMAPHSPDEWTTEDEGLREMIEGILKIFASVLSIDKKLSPKDNFYDCGGHSLLATRATSLIRRDLEVPDLPFTAIITNPTASELAKFVHALKLQSARSVRLPPHIIPLQPADFILEPKAYLFAFPFIGGDLDMVPRVVNQLDNATLGLATYGICWEPDRNLNTLEKVAAAYAESISALAGSMPCFLYGWCYGGMIACKTSLKLPKATTHIILLDVLNLSEMWRFKMDEADYSKAFAVYLSKVWFGPKLQLADKDNIMRAVQEAKLDWHDLSALVSLARKHATLPPWVTDSDLKQRMLPLSDGHDIMTSIYGHHCVSSAEALDIEERVILNLQATDGLNNIFTTDVGLGWSSYEVLGADHDTIGYLPVVSARMLVALRKVLLP